MMAGTIELAHAQYMMITMMSPKLYVTPALFSQQLKYTCSPFSTLSIWQSCWHRGDTFSETRVRFRQNVMATFLNFVSLLLVGISPHNKVQLFNIHPLSDVWQEPHSWQWKQTPSQWSWACPLLDCMPDCTTHTSYVMCITSTANEEALSFYPSLSRLG
jgi:hypothetical protein